MMTRTASLLLRVHGQWLALLLTLVLAWPAGLQAQTLQSPDWQRQAPGQRGVALALDGQGNAYVAGVAAPSVYDGGVGTMVLTRHAPDGTPQWTRTWNDGATYLGTDYAGMRVRSVFTDAAGHAVVFGDLMFFNRMISLGGGTSTIVGVAPYGWMVLKYGADGSLLWSSRQLAGSVWVGVRGVADAAGDLYLLVDPGSASATSRTVKLSGATGALLWTVATPDGARPGGIGLTLGGQVVVGMASQVFGLSLVQYAADSGAELSRHSYPQAAGYYAPALAVGPAGQVVVAGRSSDGSAAFVAAHDAALAPVFARSYAESAQATHAAVDAAGRIVVTGISAGPASNWASLRLDPLGQVVQGPLVVDRGAGATERPRDLALAADGSVVVGGAAGVPGSTAADALQATTLRYRADGSTAWLAATAVAASVVDVATAADGSAWVLADTDQTLLHYGAEVLPWPLGLQLGSTRVKGGNTVTARVTLSGSAGGVVALGSSAPTVAGVPASVRVPAGSTAASFAIRTSRVRSDVPVTIRATLNGRSVTATLTVTR